MDVEPILTALGTVSGVIALLGVAVIAGTYRERIDRHEKLLNVIVQEGLMRSWRSGRLEGMGNPTFRPLDDTVRALPEDVREICRSVDPESQGTYARVASTIVGHVGEHRLGALAKELESTPLEVLGILVAYAMTPEGGVE